MENILSPECFLRACKGWNWPCALNIHSWYFQIYTMAPRHKPAANADTAETPASASDHAVEVEEDVLQIIRSNSFVVDWYGQDDKGNPQNLPLWRKWSITMTLALYVLSTTFSSSVFSAAAAVTAEEFHVKVETMIFGGLSLFMIGFALGPIIFGYGLHRWALYTC